MAEDRAVGPEPVVNLGARLKHHRQLSGLSLRELARQLGVSPSFVSQLENSKSQPSVATLYSISQLLDVSIDELFSTDRIKLRRGDIFEKALAKLCATRPGERARLEMDSGVVWIQLATNTGTDLDFIEVIYPPHSTST